MDLEKSNCNHGVTLDFDPENWAIKTNFTNYQNTENARVKCNLHFKQGTYTITYDAFGGSGAPESQTKTYGVDLTLSSTTPTRTGYTFLGWSTSVGATSATYQAGATFSENADTTLYAVWIINTLVLYDRGNEYAQNTNGWSTKVFASYGGSDYCTYTLRKQSDSLFIYTKYNKNPSVPLSSWDVGFTTNKMIDVTHYRKLSVYLWFNTNNNAAAYISVRNSSNQTLANFMIGNGTHNNGYGTYTVNLSGISGNVYVTVDGYSTYTTNTTGETWVYKVWLSV